MFQASTMLFMYVETSLHAGTGTSDISPVDLPIQRDKTTGYPIVKASSLKGVLRFRAEATRPAEEVKAVFGPAPESTDEETFPGALILNDAQVLLFPVRSLRGVFAWVTSAGVVAGFHRDVETYLGTAEGLPGIPLPPPEAAWVAPGNRLTTPEGQLILEEFTFKAEERPWMADFARWLVNRSFPTGEAFTYWREKALRDIVVLPEDAFRFFVLHRTEIVTRIRIDRSTGTAYEGALWDEEYLPSDTLLYVPLAANAPVKPTENLKTAADVLEWVESLAPKMLQIGGGRSLGRGIVRLRWAT